jgi:hypothetical protein
MGASLNRGVLRPHAAVPVALSRPEWVPVPPRVPGGGRGLSRSGALGGGGACALDRPVGNAPGEPAPLRRAAHPHRWVSLSPLGLLVAALGAGVNLVGHTSLYVAGEGNARRAGGVLRVRPQSQVDRRISIGVHHDLPSSLVGPADGLGKLLPAQIGLPSLGATPVRRALNPLYPWLDPSLMIFQLTDLTQSSPSPGDTPLASHDARASAIVRVRLAGPGVCPDASPINQGLDN